MSQTNEQKERNERIYSMRECGATFREIGERFGISADYARQIYRRECHKVKGCGSLGVGICIGDDGKEMRRCPFCGREVVDA